MCPKSRCSCQKQNTSTPRQLQLEGYRFKNIRKNFLVYNQTTRNQFLEPALNISSPYKNMFISAKTENQKLVRQRVKVLSRIRSFTRNVAEI